MTILAERTFLNTFLLVVSNGRVKHTRTHVEGTCVFQLDTVVLCLQTSAVCLFSKHWGEKVNKVAGYMRESSCTGGNLPQCFLVWNTPEATNEIFGSNLR